MEALQWLFCGGGWCVPRMTGLSSFIGWLRLWLSIGIKIFGVRRSHFPDHQPLKAPFQDRFNTLYISFIVAFYSLIRSYQRRVCSFLLDSDSTNDHLGRRWLNGNINIRVSDNENRRSQIWGLTQSRSISVIFTFSLPNDGWSMVKGSF